MSATTTEPSAPLDYAPPPKGVRWKRVRRVAALVVLVSLLAAAWVWRDWIRLHVNQAQLLQAQRKCLRYGPPEAQVVYEEHPVRARELLNSKQYRSIARPDALIAMRDSTLPDLIYNRVPGAFPSARGALVFMHERRNERGERKLLIVQAVVTNMETSPKGILRFHMQEVGVGSWSVPLTVGNGLSTTIAGLDEARHRNPLRMYAGQPDPNDSRHFTIRYETDGVEGFLDGWEGVRAIGADGVPIPGLRLDVRPPK